MGAGVTVITTTPGNESDLETRLGTLRSDILAAVPDTSLTADQQAAIAGSQGAPGAANRFVTETDPRLGMGTRLATKHGLAGDGTTDDAAALLALGNLGGEFLLDIGHTFRIATAVTLPKNVTIRLKRTTLIQVDGVQLTIHGGIAAGLYQIFSCVNGGTVCFSTVNAEAANKRVLATRAIYPEWWGAQADNTTDDIAAINAAIAATSGIPTDPATGVRYAGPPVYFSPGVYKVTDAIQVTDVIGLHLAGAGQWNTYISFRGGEIGTATTATSTTLTNTAKNWATNTWATGRWEVYIYGGTGTGQFRIITANTNTTLTVSTPWTTTPDATSQYAICARAVFDLDGFFSGQLSELQVIGSGYFKSAYKYYRSQSKSLRGSSQGRFTNVSAISGGTGYLESAFQFGGELDNQGFQADLCTLIGCQAFGNGKTSGLYALQVGFHFGDNTFGNALNYTAIGCESVSNSYGVNVSATNLQWLGGTIQSSTKADIILHNGTQGYANFDGFRSESSAMLFDSQSTQSIACFARVANIQFNANLATGAYLARWMLPGTLIMEGIRVIANKQYTGTATSATSTTFTNTGASFPTATVTYNDGATAVGLTGWDVQITGGTGQGQRRTVSSNTATQITVDSAWDVTPDATSTYRVTWRATTQVGTNATLDANSLQLTATPIEKTVTLGTSSRARFRNYAEMDVNAVALPNVMGAAIEVVGTPYDQASMGFGVAGSPPDARLARVATGQLGIPNFVAGTMRAYAYGTTPTPRAPDKSGNHTGGTTTYTYKYVALDGAGGKALPSAPVSIANCLATLSESAYVGLYPPFASDLPFPVWGYDILKDDGTGTLKLLATVPWYKLPRFRDIGQPLTAYTAPVADSTGTLTVDRQLRVGYAASATTPGSVTGKLEVFDASGASLGFLPIYGSIT